MSSMSDILMNPLNELQELSQTLFQSLSPTQSRPPPVPPIASFSKVDDTLCAAINLAHAHQMKQRTIETLQFEILELDSRWREICEQLHRGKVELEEIISEGDKRIQFLELAKESAIPYPELLNYAERLSAFTSAPPNMPDMSVPGQIPPPLFFPPFPNEEKMRRGRLNAEGPLGELGETHSVGRPPTPSPQRQDHYNAAANPYRHDPHPAQPVVFDLDLDLNPDL